MKIPPDRRAVRRDTAAKLDPYIVPDVFFKSTVCSLYYDTDDYELIRRSIDAPVYGDKAASAQLERARPGGHGVRGAEKKFKGVVVQAGARPWARARRRGILAGGRAAPGDGQVTREIDWFLKTHEVRPARVHRL